MQKEQREKLIEDNLALVGFVLKQYFGYLNEDYLNKLGVEYDDLFQEGTVGLMDAVDGNYDPDKGEFSTFAAVCIKNRIAGFINEQNRLCGDTVSLQTPIGKDDDGRPMTLEDIIPDKDYNLEEQVISDDISEKVRAVLDDESILDDRERRVVELRFYDDCTFQEIGDSIGLTGESARLILYSALGKLKPYLEDLKDED